MRNEESRVSLNHNCQRLPRLVQITCNTVVVGSLSDEFFAFTDRITSFKSFREARRAKPLLSDIEIHETEIHVGHSERGIELDRAPVKRDRTDAVAENDCAVHPAIHRLKRVERGRGFLFQRRVVLLHGRRRLAELGPDFGRKLP